MPPHTPHTIIITIKKMQKNNYTLLPLILLIILTILPTHLCQSQTPSDNAKLVRIRLDQIGAGEVVDIGHIVSLADFVKMVQEDGKGVLAMGEMYVTGWADGKVTAVGEPVSKTATFNTTPTPKSEPVTQQQTQTKSPPTSPKQPPVPTSTPPPISTPTPTPTPPTPPVTTKPQPQPQPQPKTPVQSTPATPTTTTTTTSTTSTSNQQLLNPGQDALTNVLSKFNLPNNPFSNLLEAFKNTEKNSGGVALSQGGNDQNGGAGQGVKTENTVSTTVTTTNNGKTVTTSTVTTQKNTNPPSTPSPKSTPTPLSPAPSSSPPASTSPKPSLTSSITTLREQMRSLTNNLRAKNGAGPLTMNSLLTKIAQDHSNDMATRNFFAHQNPDGERAADRARRNGYTGMIGENLAQALSVGQAEIGFENSPTHFANAINTDWEDIGVGIASRGSFLFITVLFSPRNIANSPLTQPQTLNYKSLLSQLILQQNPSLKSLDPTLSTYIQQWMQGPRSIQLMQHIVNRGGYRTPMTAATYTVDYSKDFVDRVRKNRYFQNGNNIFGRFGIGVKQKDMKIQIYVVYM